jgi:hypothetical protein
MTSVKNHSETAMMATPGDWTHVPANKERDEMAHYRHTSGAVVVKCGIKNDSRKWEAHPIGRNYTLHYTMRAARLAAI